MVIASLENGGKSSTPRSPRVIRTFSKLSSGNGIIARTSSRSGGKSDDFLTESVIMPKCTLIVPK